MRFLALLVLFALIEPSFAPRQEKVPAKEDLVLIDGRYLHVKILSQNDRGIEVQLLDTGGKVFLPWGLIEEPYRTDIMKRFGLGAQEEKVIVEDGEHVTAKTGDTWDGRIINDTATEITLKVHGTPMVIPKSSIRDIEKTKINVLDIYSPEEYYNKRAAELKVPEDDIPGNMELGELSMDVLQLYDKAFAHFKRVQATDPGYEKEKIENILKRIEELSKNKQVRDALGEAQNSARHYMFKKALAQYDALLALKDIPETLRAEMQVWKDHYVKAHYEYFRVKIRDMYEAKLGEKLRTLSREDPLKFKLQEATKKLRSDVHKEIVAELAAALELDPKAEVEKMWEERGFHQPRIASYGSGSFIVLGRAPDADKYEAELNKYLQQSLQKQNQGKSSKSSSSGSLSAQPDKLPKPPTKDEWWTKVSSSSDREQWMKAFWAENSKKVTVVGDRREDCSRCGGSGALQFSGTQGDTLRTTCPSCQGHKYYKGVAYK